MAKEKQELTKSGKEALEKELNELINVRKPEVLDKINAAKEMGDLSENYDYKAARDEQRKIEERISEINYILDNSTVAKVDNSDKILFGKTVVFKRLDINKEMTISLVSKHEVDTSNLEHLKISVDSSIGAALLNHKAGDIVEVSAKKPYQIEVLTVINKNN